MIRYIEIWLQCGEMTNKKTTNQGNSGCGGVGPEVGESHQFDEGVKPENWEAKNGLGHRKTGGTAGGNTGGAFVLQRTRME